MARNQTFAQPHSLEAAQPPFSGTNAAEQGRCTCWVSASGLFYASPMRDERRGGWVLVALKGDVPESRLVSIGVFRLAPGQMSELIGVLNVFGAVVWGMAVGRAAKMRRRPQSVPTA
jgi:hypothetical protein